MIASLDHAKTVFRNTLADYHLQERRLLQSRERLAETARDLACRLHDHHEEQSRSATDRGIQLHCEKRSGLWDHLQTATVEELLAVLAWFAEELDG